jgi:SAM-dependent methyltransferase
MVPADLEYVGRLLRANAIRGPVLELGTGYGGSTCRDIIEANGLAYFGTDLEKGSGVDVPANFERPEQMAAFSHIAPLGTVLILNVLEHTFDPIVVLDNARSLLKPGGSLVVLTPAVWPLHNFPMDTWRILPNFYEEYARRRRMRLVDEHFEYVGFGPVSKFRDDKNLYAFPPPAQKSWRLLYGRVLHKALNTFGRAMFHPSHVAVGAVLVSDAS